MSDVVLDVTDLIFHRIIKATPTGIPRVELEYVRHFKDRSIALIRFLGWQVEPSPYLVIVGKRGWKYQNVVDLLEHCPILRNCVIERSRCPDTELATWLHHARALLFPSFIEGYGIPLIEALAQGTPVIASDIPVFHEIAGDIPDYAEPLDAKRWSKLIVDYAQPKNERRSSQCKRIAEFKVPTWNDHFARVEALMEKLNSCSQ